MTRAAFGLAIALACHASIAEDLLSYAKRWSGKYSPTDSAIGWPIMTGRFELTPISGYLDATFKDGVITVAWPRDYAMLGSPTLQRRCTQAGFYVAPNAFGAKVRVSRHRCERVQVRGPNRQVPIGVTYRDVFGVKFRGTPDTLRRRRVANRFEVEVDLLAKAPTDDDFVSVKKLLYKADSGDAGPTTMPNVPRIDDNAATTANLSRRASF